MGHPTPWEQPPPQAGPTRIRTQPGLATQGRLQPRAPSWPLSALTPTGEAVRGTHQGRQQETRAHKASRQTRDGDLRRAQSDWPGGSRAGPWTMT